MGRKLKHTVEYYPHSVHNGRKMQAVESAFGNDGYATWHKILELLGKTEYHYLNLSNPLVQSYVAKYCKVSEQILIEIIELLVELGKFDEVCWSEKIIFCKDFIDSLEMFYRKRSITPPTRSEIMRIAFEPQKTTAYLKRGPKQNTNSNINDMAKTDNSPEALNRFETWWNIYGKKVGYKKCKEKFLKLKPAQQLKCLEHSPLYVLSTPDKQYRKHPLTYLNGECYNDEIIIPGQRGQVEHLNSGDGTDWDSELKQLTK